MRLDRIAAVFLAFALLTCALAAVSETAPEAPASPGWFHVGEELIYEIHWGVFSVGATHVITDWHEHEGRKVIRIRYITRTTGILERLYPVDDLIESLVDPETFLPIRFTKKLSEGSYRCDEVTYFNFRKLKAGWESRLNGRKKAFAIEPDTRDIVTFMYYLRAQPFEPGETRMYRVMADEKLYDLKVKVGDRIRAKFPGFGDVTSVKIDPEAAFQGIFVRKGKVTIWVSDDERRVCTRLMVSVPVANVRLTLREVRGPGDDFWTAKSRGNEESASGGRTGGLTQDEGPG